MGDSEGQGILVCYSPWSHKEPDTAEQLTTTNNESWDRKLQGLRCSRVWVGSYKLMSGELTWPTWKFIEATYKTTRSGNSGPQESRQVFVSRKWLSQRTGFKEDRCFIENFSRNRNWAETGLLHIVALKLGSNLNSQLLIIKMLQFTLTALISKLSCPNKQGPHYLPLKLLW